jgi:hypothetical protein
MASLLASTASVSGQRDSTVAVAALPPAAVKSLGTWRAGNPAACIAARYAATARQVHGSQVGPDTIAIRRRPPEYRWCTIAVVKQAVSTSKEGTAGEPAPIDAIRPAMPAGTAWST